MTSEDSTDFDPSDMKRPIARYMVFAMGSPFWGDEYMETPYGVDLFCEFADGNTYAKIVTDSFAIVDFETKCTLEHFRKVKEESKRV